MATPVTIQPATKDTFIAQQGPTNNYGTSTTLIISPTTTSTEIESILSFDFSASVPAGAIITSATLSLYCWANLAGRTIYASRLLRTNWVETEATWNIYKTSNNWGTAGAKNSSTDFTTTNQSSTGSPAINSWADWDVTAQVQTALDSVSGVAHFLLTDSAAGTGDMYFRSSNYSTDTTKCPKLVIYYTINSFSPSASPSISPSKSPSFSPSRSPSKSPSFSSSKSPSRSPSKSPSFSPSISPSRSPSVSPSISPSVSPSIEGPENVYTEDATYASARSSNGVLGIQLSKNAGANWHNILEKTFGAGETTETYGNGSTELWGTSWDGSHLTDTNFRLRMIITQIGARVIYKTFEFTIAASPILTGIEIAVKAYWNGTRIYINYIGVKIYYGTSVLPVQAGSQAFANDGRKPSEGVGSGTGMLVYFDGINWCSVVDGSAVDD